MDYFNEETLKISGLKEKKESHDLENNHCDTKVVWLLHF